MNNVELELKRRVDHHGRVAIPVELRRLLGIRPHDTVGLCVEQHALVIRHRRNTCLICGADKQLIAHESTYVCQSCLEQLNTKGGQET